MGLAEEHWRKVGVAGGRTDRAKGQSKCSFQISVDL